MYFEAEPRRVAKDPPSRRARGDAEQDLRTLEGKERPERYRSQLTLAQRRIRALEIALFLIRGALEERGGET